MPARFEPGDADIRWVGVDDDTPPGHCIAIGKDSLGNAWLWLFTGDTPSADAFVGSIEIPAQITKTPSAYGRFGGWAGLAHNTRQTLEQLAEADDGAHSSAGSA
ncbi:hypothetical protein [Streptomyces sp. NPDC101455]|uniref:hypothetical protein n=1 Tax=Streptomyces sp. NPDC101455 TaxID=3366142 RepID=UPI00381D5BAC